MAPSVKPLSPAQPLRVFVCDDDREFALEMAEGLAAHGFLVRPLGSGSPVAAMQDFRPDILLLDIFMPAPNGFEILKVICDDALLREVPLVLMSGTDTGLLDVAEQFCAARKLKLAGTYQKPLRLTDMARICAEAGEPHRLGTGHGG
jgi:PleD family two-component response regulator